MRARLRVAKAEQKALDAEEKRLRSSIRRIKQQKIAIKQKIAVERLLTPTPRELVLIKQLMLRLGESYGRLGPVPKDKSAIMWMLAREAVRPHLRGRKAKWQGADGRALVDDVEEALRERGTKMVDVVEALREAHPARYGDYSAESLVKRYYEARRRERHGSALPQSGKSAE